MREFRGVVSERVRLPLSQLVPWSYIYNLLENWESLTIKVEGNYL